MQSRLPPLALIIGVALLLPYVGCGLAALSFDDPEAESYLLALIGYGAVHLGLFGGVHWGFALASADPAHERRRLALGVLPMLFGWLALLTPLLLPLDAGLGVLIAGFIAVVLGEASLARDGLVPGGYMWLRWGTSVVVVAILVTVLTLRLLGARIVF